MKCTARIDEAACVAQGDCEEIAPAVFEVDDVARVNGEGEPELILAAAESCPTGAISVVDVETGEAVYP